MTKLKTVRTVKGAPAKKGKCPVRPPLDGVLKDGRVVNAMLFCRFARRHTGKHSWEL